MNKQRLLQALVLLFGTVSLISYLSFLPDYYERLAADCVLDGCGITSPAPPTTLALLREAGFTVNGYAMWFVVLDSTFTLLYATAAFVILFKGWREPMAMLASAMLIAFGTTFPQLIHAAAEAHPFWYAWFDGVGFIGWITLFLFFAMFPDGRLLPKRAAMPILAFGAIKLAGMLLPGSMLDHNTWPLWPSVLLFAVPIAALIYSQFYRYRRMSSPEQRQQTKWVVYGLTVGLLAFMTISILFDPDLYRSPVAFIYLNGALHLFLLVIPLTLCLAILRMRLWDVDPVVKRSIVYLALTASIAALYGSSILYFGALFRTGDRFAPSLISAMLVAVLFAPLKSRLQRTVDRLLKGRHDDPYGMLSELRSLLVKPLPPEAMLETIVRYARQALRIPYAAIAIKLHGQERLAVADPEHAATDQNYSVPIVHRGMDVGVFHASSRPGEPFTQEDLRLLDVWLGHAGPIVDNYRMTRGMKLLADDLQRSRERLVLAREEERRAIRRNLHDELAPRLAAIGLHATAAEMNVRTNPAAATEQLGELREVVRSSIADIRALVRDMRPASLDEWGLVGAVQERIRELTAPLQVMEASDGDDPAYRGLRIAFDAPERLPPLPAAIEVAAYWIMTESIANVVRHAQASVCKVRLTLSPKRGELTIEVTDDGIGVDERMVGAAIGTGERAASGGTAGGIGLGSLRERAAELGGECVIERVASGGTCVRAILPVSIDSIRDA